jgi:hypothetical protein
MYENEQEWREAGQKLAKTHSEDMWAVARWIACAQSVGWDKKYAHASKITGLSEGTCKQYAHTVRALTQVNPALSFTHHRLVAAIPAMWQMEWLDRAAREKMTVAQLEAALKGNEGPKNTVARPPCVRVPLSSEVSGSLNALARHRKISAGPGISPGAVLLARIASNYVSAQEQLQELAHIREQRAEEARHSRLAGVKRWQNNVHNRIAQLFEAHPDVSDPGDFADIYHKTYGRKLPLWALAHSEFSERFGDCSTEDCHIGVYSTGEDSEMRMEDIEEMIDSASNAHDAFEEAQRLMSLLPQEVQSKV